MNDNIYPRMRTLKQAAAELRAADAETAFTEKALRRAVADGVLPFVQVGNRKLVDMNKLESYLAGEIVKAEPQTASGIIRRIS